MKAIYLILLSVLFVSSGQILIKYGLSGLGELSFAANDIPDTAQKILLNPLILLGIAVFVTSSILWLTALSRTELSYAYPLLSIGYAVVAIMSWLIFNEKMSLLRIAGVITIMIAVSMLAFEKGEPK
jgi:multidrug transporter EmrE-like cation transporter